MQVLQESTSLPVLQVWPGVTVRVVNGEKLTMAIAELEPGILVPEHRHSNEQIGMVLAGSALFTVEGRTEELTVGGSYRFLANVPHQVEAGPAGAVFVECFSPPRADWSSLPEAAEPVLRWPPA
jgi:quercetin dioxygenase-like cupin family protein